MNLVIIGGSDAGISAALRARELDSTVSVMVIVADAFPNYSVCGIPFYLSGEVPDWHALAHRTADDLSRLGITLLLNHTAQMIDIQNHLVMAVDLAGRVQEFTYDHLILATGAVSLEPKIAGLHLPGVYQLRSMDDSFAIQHFLETRVPRSAIIIGGGYIGLEMADALTLKHIAVTVVEHAPSLLKTVDPALGSLVGAELQHHGVQIVCGVAIERIEKSNEQLCVLGSQGFEAQADLVLVAVGVRPASNLAKHIGIELGQRDAIRVNRAMETSQPAISAAGDCVETWHRLLQKSTYLPLGSTAHKQGRVAGANAVGKQELFAGTLGTQVVKVFDLVIARTGLREEEAQQAGFVPLTVATTFLDHKGYYPGAHPIHIHLTGDLRTGHLLGAQMVGHLHSEVAKRIDVFAVALTHHMLIDDLNSLDLAYTPPLSSPWDPIQMSAQAWEAQRLLAS